MTPIERESMWCELTNSSHRMTGATLRGWRIRRRPREANYRCVTPPEGLLYHVDVWPVEIEVALVSGYSSQDHLFDRALVEIERALETQDAQEVTENASWRNGRPEFRTVAAGSTLRRESDIPEGIRPLVERAARPGLRQALRDQIADLEAARVYVSAESWLQSAECYVVATWQPDGFRAAQGRDTTWGGVTGRPYYRSWTATDATIPAGWRVSWNCGTSPVLFRDEAEARAALAAEIAARRERLVALGGRAAK